MDKIDRLRSILVCPECSASLGYSQASFLCQACNTHFPIRDGKVFFVEAPSRTDDLDDIKGKLKNLLGKYYYRWGIQIVAPSFPFSFARWVQRFVDPREKIVIEIGCGSDKIHPDAIGIDLFPYRAVDVVCDLNHLPFRAASVDAFVSRSVLEHVRENWKVVEGLKSCTRPGGYQMHGVPFLFPFHSSPHDFYRFTHRGLETMFEDWRKVHQHNPSGPVSLFLTCFIEFLSILLSGGWGPLKSYIYLALCLLLFPIKFLDFPFIGRKSFLTLAPSIFTVFQKPLP